MNAAFCLYWSPSMIVTMKMKPAVRPFGCLITKTLKKHKPLK